MRNNTGSNILHVIHLRFATLGEGNSIILAGILLSLGAAVLIIIFGQTPAKIPPPRRPGVRY